MSEISQFNAAMEKWQTLRAEGSFSVAPNIGRIAIITSPVSRRMSGTLRNLEELEGFNEEARVTANSLSQAGRKVDVAIGATSADLDDLIADPQVDSLYMIGHGSLSSFSTAKGERYDWIKVAHATNHLKLGTVTQLQRGDTAPKGIIPLGLFLVSDMQNLYVDVGQTAHDNMHTGPEPLFRSRYVSYEDIVALGNNPEACLERVSMKRGDFCRTLEQNGCTPPVAGRVWKTLTRLHEHRVCSQQPGAARINGAKTDPRYTHVPLDLFAWNYSGHNELQLKQLETLVRCAEQKRARDGDLSLRDILGPGGGVGTLEALSTLVRMWREKHSEE